MALDSPGTRPLLVVHIGVVAETPGGMAQVINEYLSWKWSAVTLRAFASTKGKRDALAVFRWGLCVLRLIGFRLRGTRAVFVVHMSHWGSFVREGSLVVLARLMGHPVGVHIHGSDFDASARRLRQVLRPVLRAADAVFVLTESAASTVRDVAGARELPVLRIANAVAVPEESDRPIGHKEIVFCGEVGYRKGVDLLLKAWADLDHLHGEWTLRLIGPVSPHLQADVAAARAVVCTGALSRPAALEFQSQALIAVLPSRNEAMPMFLIEAMARGCAVVATDVGQVRDLVGEGAQAGGIVVPREDVAGLTAALELLCRDDSVRTARAASARQRVEARYSAESVLRELECAWLDMAGSAGRGR